MAAVTGRTHNARRRRFKGVRGGGAGATRSGQPAARPPAHRMATAGAKSAALLALLLLAAAAGQEADDADVEEDNTLDAGGGGREGKLGPGLGALGRSVLTELARQLVTGTATNSQVLSLNLTNLLILLVLKALLFGAGIFSFGLLGQKNGAAGHVGRSLDGEGAASQPALSETELLLALSYLIGDAGHRYDCLYRVACAEPKKAREYAAAARMLLKGAKLLDQVVPYNPRYELLVAELQKAADYGLTGESCGARYACARPGPGPGPGPDA